MLTIIEKTKKMLVDHLGEKLDGIFLHGSYVLGGLRKNSDIDFLVVINKPLTIKEQAAITKELLKLSGEIGSGKRYLEVSIVNRLDPKFRKLPNKLAYIYGEWLRDDFLSEVEMKPHTDAEYPIFLYQALLFNEQIWGEKTLAELLPKIDVALVRASMKEIVTTLDFDDVIDDMTNTLLLFCRMLYFADTGLFTDKATAGKYVIDKINEPTLIRNLQIAVKHYEDGNVSRFTDSLEQAFLNLQQLVLQVL